ncbi:hypothetical protein F9802_12950 [Bacillus aerolatus]|uniref:Lipoprotein n=1 Tax=Bacillus aerolatus TaxID=2653354 RepID=A0A6I1FE39_9BACI|nr:hypothetical protein [Bacillus aerolatus]KAB7705967.1 hypothetical protein F9802_12950 [Bacillus aerolatus]
MVKKLLSLFVLLTLIVGCSPSYDETGGYKESTINKDFPVPANAEPGEANFGNPNIEKGVKYKLKNIGGEQGLLPPQRYFQEIEKLGWKEEKDKQMGSVHFFKKDDTVIAVEIEENSFDLYQLKEGAPY